MQGLFDFARADGIQICSAVLHGALGLYGRHPNGSPEIVLARDAAPVVRTATLAHELGHHLTEWSPEHACDSDQEEALADGFAATLLASSLRRRPR